ncbi:hypothetical protein JKY72_00520 [Candidatus Gracilibacteria bacterium]|nr:hypothetical protein [Candidatus Gracilibacteria bacterium]
MSEIGKKSGETALVPVGISDNDVRITIDELGKLIHLASLRQLEKSDAIATAEVEEAAMVKVTPEFFDNLARTYDLDRDIFAKLILEKSNVRTQLLRALHDFFGAETSDSVIAAKFATMFLAEVKKIIHMFHLPISTIPWKVMIMQVIAVILIEGR